MPPQCNGGLFARRLVDPKGGCQLVCPPLASGGLALGEVTCGECGDALSLQYSFLLASLSRKYTTLFFVVYGCGEKKRAKKPETPHPRSPGTCQRGLRGYARPPKTAKNRGILILRTHVSPHLGAEAWAQVVVTLATHRLRTK